MALKACVAAAISFGSLATAQFPPTPEGVKELQSKFHPGVKVSYKEPGLCETTPGVKSYAGYVRLPPHALNETHQDNDYPINTFYWFFESRKDPANAPLAIWLNGGPGGSSMIGALSENGPCFVSNDSRSTYLNPWSWNNEANLLFIDQPNQVGYSYDTPTNVTVDLANEGGLENGGINFADFSKGVPETNNTFLVGTVSSQNLSHTANSTQHAAVALWHFAQTWFEEFPQYKPNDEQLALFTESYGGHYGPGFWDYFAHQNAKIEKGKITGHSLHLTTLGVINGCIDAPDMIESEINFAYNNTYGIEAITKESFEHSIHEFHKTGGALDDINKCRDMARKTDPHDYGDVKKTNSFCSQASERATNISDMVFVKAGRGGRFDVTHEATDPFPPPYMIGWLNNHETQRAFGVPVNHSWVSPTVAEAFSRTGDLVKGGQKDQISYLLAHGVNVALFHGDRDFACNWIGGENTSLNIPWTYKEDFAKAGYTPLITTPGVETGLIRQYGNFSFTRVFQAGHMVPSYQPEAAYRIFMRALTGKDIATGEIDLQEYAATHKDQYSTSGPSDTWWRKNEVQPAPPHECYVLDMSGRCSEEEIGWIVNGTAIVKDFIVVGNAEDKNEKGDQRLEFEDFDLHGGQHPLMADWTLFELNEVVGVAGEGDLWLW